MRQYPRSARINRLIQEEVSDIIRTRLKDPRIGFVSVTRVDTTEDLRSSKIYVSVLDESDAEESLLALGRAAGVVRGELRQRLHTRRVPELRFLLDRNIAYGAHIAEVLEGLRTDEKEDEGGSEE